MKTKYIIRILTITLLGILQWIFRLKSNRQDFRQIGMEH